MNKYIHRLILLTPIFMIALYGCARYEPPSEFVAPTYNPKTIPNPPIYPNKRLSSDAVKIPDKVIDFKEVQPFTKLYKIVWYEPTNIGFIGQGHTYIYSVESNRFNKVDDIIIKNNIEERFRNTQIEWVEDTSTLRQTAEWAGFAAQLLFTPLSRLGSVNKSKTKTYQGNVSTLDGAITVPIEKKERFIRGSDIAFPKYYFKDKILKSSKGTDIYQPPKHLTPDGNYILIKEGFVNATTGQIIYSAPVTQGKSLAPVVLDYFFNPDLTKLLLLYETSDDEKMPSYSIEIVDYVLPELKRNFNKLE